MEHKEHLPEPDILECEKPWVFLALMMSAGWLGAFTYVLRGGVFCNAQTGNLVRMSIALGSGHWQQALYYLIPISAYLLGTILSELLPNKVKRLHFLRWDTLLVGIEALVVFVLGLIPDAWPVQITQITINFICSMQYNTFRQANHVPMATTFCTNHVRQTGVFLAKAIQHPGERANLRRSLSHVRMLAAFALGAMLSTIACGLFQGRSIWGSCLLLLVVFVDLAHADLTTEKNLMNRKPSGH